MPPTDDSPRTDPNPGLVADVGATPDDRSEASGSREVRATPISFQASRGDTLLSAPPQATKDDLALDQRLSECERQLAELGVRLKSLERRPVDVSDSAAGIRWFWLLFLAAVALAWQIVSHFR